MDDERELRSGSGQQNEFGRWVPAEPLPDSFGLRWERMIRSRRACGQSRVRAWVGGWRDVREVDRMAAEVEQLVRDDAIG